MTSRERWTVYPLLFLALGMGIRNRQMDVMHYKAIQCEELKLVGKDGKTLAALGSLAGKEGLLQFVDEKSHVTAVLGTIGSKGNLRLIGPDQKSWVNVGFEEPQAGLVVGLPANNLVRVPGMFNVSTKPASQPGGNTKETRTENSTEESPKAQPTPENPTPEATTPDRPADPETAAEPASKSPI